MSAEGALGAMVLGQWVKISAAASCHINIMLMQLPASALSLPVRVTYHQMNPFSRNGLHLSPTAYKKPSQMDVASGCYKMDVRVGWN